MTHKCFYVWACALPFQFHDCGKTIFLAAQFSIYTILVMQLLVHSKSNCKHFFRTNWFLFSACLNHQHDYIMAHVLSSQTCSKKKNDEIRRRRRKSKITTSFYMFYKRLYGKQAHFTFAYSALKLTKTIAKMQKKKEIITSNVCK